jgi:hypothetical protein
MVALAVLAVVGLAAAIRLPTRRAGEQPDLALTPLGGGATPPRPVG